MTSHSDPLVSTTFNDTVYFGGTMWSVESNRWEALRDSVWTFDSGVGSHFNQDDPEVEPKDPSLHARMEGWVGRELKYGVSFSPAMFRRLSVADFGTTVCVGSPAGLGGNYSFWAGLLPSEWPFVYLPGYGNGWDIVMERSFEYPGTGSATLSFDYRNDTEPGFDYTYVTMDTAGTGEDVFLTEYTGLSSGHASITLNPGTHLPSSPRTITIRFRVTSDGSYSDEDGLYQSQCGAFAVDNIHLTGAISSGPFTFETDDGGWTSRAGPEISNDWSDIVALSSLPPPLSGPCALQDSVLVFAWRNESESHNCRGTNIAMSPWINLQSAGLSGSPRKFVEFDFYIEPEGGGGACYADYTIQLFVQWAPCWVQWNQSLDLMSLLHVAQVYYPLPTCSPPGTPLRIDLTQLIPPGTETFRLGLGMSLGCDLCGSALKLAPYFDNVRVGVTGFPVPLLPPHAPPEDVLTWGTTGTGSGQFQSPSGLAVDANGFVYVSDNYRVQKFDADGNFVQAFGSQGSGPGQLLGPGGLAVGLDGNVYVCDRASHRIEVFSPTGDFIHQWGTYGPGNGQFYYPSAVAVGSDGSVYVADTSNNRVQKFTAGGVYVTQWPAIGARALAVGPDGNVYAGVGSPGSDPNRRINVFDDDGALIRSWGSRGLGCAGLFSYIRAVSIDSNGDVYICDDSYDIQKFTPYGVFLTRWGSDGVGPGQFRLAVDLVVDPTASFVYVVDSNLNRVQRFGYSIVGVPEPGASLAPRVFPPYPNPTSTSSAIRLRLPQSTPGRMYEVSALVFDVAGRIVRTVFEDQLPAGDHALRWDGSDQAGSRTSSGLYFFQVRVDDEIMGTSKVLRLP